MLSVSALPIPCSGESGGVLDLGEVELDFFVLVVDILHDRLYFMQTSLKIEHIKFADHSDSLLAGDN